MQVVRIDSTESTNKYCEALDLAQVEDFTCYWALEQTAGIGQRGNHWEAAPGQNLTFSLVLHPSFLPADRQFKLTEALSLAIADFLATFRLQTPIRIKWPNDIYVGGKKLCGILVSVRLAGGGIAAAVCGIGLNVNQRSFPDWVPNPTSLGLLSGRHYELEPLLGQLLECVWRRYDALREGADPEREYLDCLLNLDVQARYRYNGEVVVATITGVDRHGRLLLTAADGRRLVCGMKDIASLS